MRPPLASVELLKVTDDFSTIRSEVLRHVPFVLIFSTGLSFHKKKQNKKTKKHD